MSALSGAEKSFCLLSSDAHCEGERDHSLSGSAIPISVLQVKDSYMSSKITVGLVPKEPGWLESKTACSDFFLEKTSC